MKHKNRALALLLAVCTLIACMTGLSFAADTPTSMTISELAAASGAVKTAVNAAIVSGTKESNGVYKDIMAPTTITVGNYAMGIEDYTFMAAQAILLIDQGKSSDEQVAYQEVGLADRSAIGDAVTTINAGQILDLANRVANYGGAMDELATSHNRPTDGTNVFDGRICIFTIAEAFAATLEHYASNGALADSVTITPSSYTTEETVDPEDTTTEPPAVEDDDWYAAVIAAAVETEAYVLEKEDMPESFTILGKTVSRAQFFSLTAQAIVGINNGTTSGTLELLELSEPGNPQETVSPGSVELTEIIDLAERAAAYCVNNGQAPNYMNSSLGGIHYLESIYFFCKNLQFYSENGRLPNYCGVSLWTITTGNYVEGEATFGVDYSAYASYLVPTTNCQSTNATIISVAQTGMNYDGGKSWGSTPTTTYQAMWNLFEYLNDKTSYEYYFDTSRGAYGTWRDKKGNCCDMAHLMNACARSLGVPARYAHGYCHFSTMSCGHVWSNVLCGSTWYTADLVSYYNYLGYKTNTTGTFYSYYITLPF